MPRPKTQSERFNFLLPLTGGNEEAALLLVHVGDMIRIADDVADGDHPDPQEGVAEVLLYCLGTIPGNLFYDHHRAVLAPMLASMVACWQTSNRFHKSADENLLTFGFVLREAGEVFTMQVIALCVGWQAAASALEAIRLAMIEDGAETVAAWAGETK